MFFIERYQEPFLNSGLHRTGRANSDRTYKKTSKACAESSAYALQEMEKQGRSSASTLNEPYSRDVVAADRLNQYFKLEF